MCVTLRIGFCVACGMLYLSEWVLTVLALQTDFADWTYCWWIELFLADMPSLSGVSDMDYPLQGPGLVNVPSLPELSPFRRVPLPPELVEQFSRILPWFIGISNEMFVFGSIDTETKCRELALDITCLFVVGDVLSRSLFTRLWWSPLFSTWRCLETTLNFNCETLDMQCNCMMGVFPEISRAWLTIDNDIFMWNYEDG